MLQLGLGVSAGGSNGVDAVSPAVPPAAAASADDASVLSGWDYGPSHVIGFLTPRRCSRQRRRLNRVIIIVYSIWISILSSFVDLFLLLLLIGVHCLRREKYLMCIL